MDTKHAVFEGTGETQSVSRPDQTPAHQANSSTGDEVELFWELGNNFYPGHVSSISPTGQYVINYDDGEVEAVNLSTEIWRYQQTDPLNGLTPTTNELHSNYTEVLNTFFW